MEYESKYDLIGYREMSPTKFWREDGKPETNVVSLGTQHFSQSEHQTAIVSGSVAST